MNTLLLVFVITLITLQNVTKKIGSKKSNSAMSFSGASALFAIIIFLITSGGKLNFSTEILPYSIMFAVSYGIGCAFSFLSISEGPLSLTTLITSYSLVVPTVYGLLFLGEPITPLLIAGIALLLISLLLINYEKQNGERKITLKWAIFVFLAFVGNGVCSTVQKVQQLEFDGAYKSEFMIAALAIASLTLLIISVFTEKKQLVTNLRYGFVWFLICKILNYF